MKDALDRYPVSEQVYIIAERVEPILAVILKIGCVRMQFCQHMAKTYPVCRFKCTREMGSIVRLT